jgi:hypothetical protein
MKGLLLIAAAAVLPATALLTAAGAPPADVDTYLKSVGFAGADFGTLEGGQVIARVDTGDSGEIVTLGAVKVRAPRAQTTAYYGQMIAYVDGQVTLAFGKFSNPPSMDDVKGLTLDRDEIAAIRSCKPGSCDIKIGGVGLDAVRRGIDWKAADADARVQDAVRRAAVDYVTGYMKRGDEALVTYADTSKPVSLKDQWRGIVNNSGRLQQYAPSLRDYLLAYPNGSLPGGRDILYWIKENYGLKPTITIVHGVIYQAPDRPDRTTVVQKQIYASHYYDASLAVATLFDGVENGAPITYIVYANRSRGDMLKGGFGGLKRKVARDQAKTATVDTLTTIKTQLEQRAH